MVIQVMPFKEDLLTVNEKKKKRTSNKLELNKALMYAFFVTH